MKQVATDIYLYCDVYLSKLDYQEEKHVEQGFGSIIWLLIEWTQI